MGKIMKRLLEKIGEEPEDDQGSDESVGDDYSSDNDSDFEPAKPDEVSDGTGSPESITEEDQNQIKDLDAEASALLGHPVVCTPFFKGPLKKLTMEDLRKCNSNDEEAQNKVLRNSFSCAPKKKGDGKKAMSRIVIVVPEKGPTKVVTVKEMWILTNVFQRMGMNTPGKVTAFLQGRLKSTELDKFFNDKNKRVCSDLAMRKFKSAAEPKKRKKQAETVQIEPPQPREREPTPPPPPRLPTPSPKKTAEDPPQREIPSGKRRRVVVDANAVLSAASQIAPPTGRAKRHLELPDTALPVKKRSIPPAPAPSTENLPLQDDLMENWLDFPSNDTFVITIKAKTLADLKEKCRALADS